MRFEALKESAIERVIICPCRVVKIKEGGVKNGKLTVSCTHETVELDANYWYLEQSIDRLFRISKALLPEEIARKSIKALKCFRLWDGRGYYEGSYGYNFLMNPTEENFRYEMNNMKRHLDLIEE